jgi:hypothetical protein
MTDDVAYALAAQLNYEHARRYVESRGWTREKSRRADLGIFRFGQHEAVLPMDTELRDFSSAMIMFARRVSEVEGRSVEQVLSDLTAANMDRHRPARVSASDAPGASLDAASAMLDGISRALLSAACSALQPRAFHPRMTLSSAESFIADARFMNTEAGSFVMVVDTPTEVEGARPGFGRESSVLLVRSLAHIARAIRAGTPDRVANPEPGEPQVSANLCDAILQMAPANEAADLRFAVSWSPLVAPAENVPMTVTIDRHMYEAVEKLARQMRPSESNAPKRYLGMVRELKGTPGPTGIEGEVVFVLVSEDGTPTRAKAQLNPEQYFTAITAHATPRPVVVEAERHRVSRGYELRNITGVWVYQEPEGE